MINNYIIQYSLYAHNTHYIQKYRNKNINLNLIV